jgi:hypothetical protein
MTLFNLHSDQTGDSALPGKAGMTMPEIHDWLSKCLTEGLGEEDDLLEHLQVAMECLYSQGAISNNAFNEIYVRLHEASALLSVIPQPKGWQIQEIWRAGPGWRVEITLPATFDSYIEAQIAAGSTQSLCFDGDTLTVIIGNGQGFRVTDQHVRVLTLSDEGKMRAANWLQRPDALSNDAFELTRVRIADFANINELSVGFERVTDRVVPAFGFDREQPSLAFGMELNPMPARLKFLKSPALAAQCA